MNNRNQRAIKEDLYRMKLIQKEVEQWQLHLTCKQQREGVLDWRGENK